MAMTPEAPVFSIVIPTRNGEPYLRETIDSVLSQHYPHFHLFILESDSTDQTLKIANEYAQRDTRVRVVTSDEPLDIQGNWGRIFELELDEYLTILGHDDVLYADFLETIARLIADEPGASLYHTHFHILDVYGAVERASLPVPYRQEADEFLAQVHANQQNVSATGYVLRAADYRQLGGFPMLPRLLFADFLFWYRVAALGYKVCSPVFACGFRMHPASTTQSTQLLDAYDAAVAYFRALELTSFFRDPANRQGTLAYLNAYFRGRQLRAVLEAMQSDNKQRLVAYEQVQNALVHQAERDGLIHVQSPSLGWLQRLAHVRSRTIRRVLLSGIELLFSTRRQLSRLRNK